MESVTGMISQGPGRIVFLTIVVILIWYALFKLYKWLNGEIGDIQDVVIYASSDSGLPGKSNTATVFNDVNVPPLYQGGEYSISAWIYITNWSINNGLNKPFLTLSGGGPQGSGFATIVMYLGQFVNKLGIRVSQDSMTNDASSTIDYVTQMPMIVKGTSPYSDTAVDFKKCDIETVDLQRWVNITAVLSGRTLDVYIDGKLSRSCVLNGLFKVDGDKPMITLGGPNGFGGIIGLVRAANVAYSPDKVYKYYQDGPFDSSFSLSNLGAYSFDIKKNGNSIFSSSIDTNKRGPL